MNRKLAYAIPNLFTVGSLISALFALTLTSDGHFINAAWLITLSIILDGMDGKMARLLNATSKIGAQADSLADFVAFGIVPAFLVWKCCLFQYGFVGYVLFVAYILCGGFRLARFNVLMERPSVKEEFMGLPIPGGAAIVASFVLFDGLILKNISILPLLPFILPCISYLMTSHVPYIAVNKAHVQKKRKNMLIFIAGILIVLAIKYFVWVYFVGAWFYVFFGLYNQIKLSVRRIPKRERIVKQAHRRGKK